MAFDARWEDFQRMFVRFAQSLDETEPLAAAHAFSSFGRRYAQERDALPQTDVERAFHLVTEARRLIDYQLPFVPDEEVEPLIARGHQLLEEAIALDPHCYDAIRMEGVARVTSFEGYYDFLVELEPEVRAYCMEARTAAQNNVSPERAEIAMSLAVWPHLRWLAMIASKALICGRNREAIRICDELLTLDPNDAADARFTASLAYAKLEDEQGLDQLEARCSSLSHARANDHAWALVSRLALAHRRRDLPRARQFISKITEAYPRALVTLARQQELPDGAFARIAVQPFSDDELVLAMSEATVLTQEGRDSLGRGALGSWLLQECLSRATREELSELRETIENMGSQLSLGGSEPEGGPR